MTECAQDDPHVRWAPLPARAVGGFLAASGADRTGMVSRGLLALTLLIPIVVGVAMMTSGTAADPLVPSILIVIFGGLEATVIADLSRVLARRRSAARIADLAKEHGHMAWCPQCGGDPFDGTPCCRGFPRGWTWRELHACWPELACVPLGRGSESKLALARPRGPVQSSWRHPRGGWRMTTGRRWGLGVRVVLTMVAVGIFGSRLISVMIAGWNVMIVLMGLLTLTLIPPTIRLWRDWKRIPLDSLPSEPCCRSCGYQLHPPFSNRCTECGGSLDAWNAVSFIPAYEGDRVSTAAHTG
jgi:hypothetical protein